MNALMAHTFSFFSTLSHLKEILGEVINPPLFVSVEKSLSSKYLCFSVNQTNNADVYLTQTCNPNYRSTFFIAGGLVKVLQKN